MFDDPKFKTENNAGEPEDIFAKVAGGEPEETFNNSSGVFAAAESPAASLPPNQPVSTFNSAAQPPAANRRTGANLPPIASPLADLPNSSTSGSGKIIMIVVIILVVIGAMAVGGWFVYAKLIAGKVTGVNLNAATMNTNWGDEWENINTAPAIINENLNNNLNSTMNFNENINENLNSNFNNNINSEAININAAPAIDSDHDGLTDEEEAKLGTDPNKKDTDGDGLYDRTEVMIYCTDPLKTDTDGDSYLDGEEVKNHYNPNGPGKIDVNASIDCGAQGNKSNTNSSALGGKSEYFSE